MSISGVGATPEPQNNIKAQNPQNADDGKPVSIFDYNKDGTVTVEEQTQALNDRITNLYEKFKDSLDKYGFNIDEFKNKFISQFVKRDAKTDYEVKLADNMIEGVIINAEEELINEVNNSVDRELDSLKTSVTMEISLFLMSFDISEKGKQKAEDYKQGIKILVEMKPEYEEWGKEMLELLNSRYPDK